MPFANSGAGDKIELNEEEAPLYRQMEKHKMIADRKDAKGLVLNTLNGVVLFSPPSTPFKSLALPRILAAYYFIILLRYLLLRLLVYPESFATAPLHSFEAPVVLMVVPRP